MYKILNWIYFVYKINIMLGSGNYIPLSFSAWRQAVNNRCYLIGQRSSRGVITTVCGVTLAIAAQWMRIIVAKNCTRFIPTENKTKKKSGKIFLNFVYTRRDVRIWKPACLSSCLEAEKIRKFFYGYALYTCTRARACGLREMNAEIVLLLLLLRWWWHPRDSGASRDND